MQITTKSCSALHPNADGGQRFAHKHATTAACFGNSYPSGQIVPTCVREDRLYDEDEKRMRITPWTGA